MKRRIVALGLLALSACTPSYYSMNLPDGGVYKQVRGWGSGIAWVEEPRDPDMAYIQGQSEGYAEQWAPYAQGIAEGVGFGLGGWFISQANWGVSSIP